MDDTDVCGTEDNIDPMNLFYTDMVYKYGSRFMLFLVLMFLCIVLCDSLLLDYCRT